jgi:hypothetical protein
MSNYVRHELRVRLNTVAPLLGSQMSKQIEHSLGKRAR